MGLCLRMKIIIISLCVTIFTHGLVLANEITRGDKIIATVETWAEAQGLDLSADINGRRAYPACNQALSVEPRYMGDYNTLKISCDDFGAEWDINISTRKLSKNTNTANTNMAVVIATTSLPKGTVIRDKDIKLKIGSNKNSGQYFNELDDVIGRRAQRAINANQMIKPQYLTSVWMVEKDQSVILVNKSERIQVEAMGTALENGNFGDRIRVINNKSGQKLLGKVESEKKIQIISKIN